MASTEPVGAAGRKVSIRLRRIARAIVERLRTVHGLVRRDPVPTGGRPCTSDVPTRSAVSDPAVRLTRLRLARVKRGGPIIVGAPSSGSDVTRLVALARAGVPLCSSAAAGRFPEPLGPVGEVTADDLRPPGECERQSVRLRRAVWAAEIGRPMISVVLSSKRPEALPSALAMIGSQRDVDVELVVGLHGDGWSADHVASVSAAAPAGAEIDRFDATLDLGDVLQRLSVRTSGPLVAKWDDDDWYGPHHLLDLAIAAHYTGADIVGKAAEFVYLEAADETIRRFGRSAERYSRNLAGGAMAIRRPCLDDVGGWPSVPRHVDQRLIDAVVSGGGTAYRTHGFDYLLTRRPPAASDHTWTAGDEYFLSDARRRWAGRRLDVVGVEGP